MCGELFVSFFFVSFYSFFFVEGLLGNFNRLPSTQFRFYKVTTSTASSDPVRALPLLYSPTRHRIIMDSSNPRGEHYPHAATTNGTDVETLPEQIVFTAQYHLAAETMTILQSTRN